MSTFSLANFFERHPLPLVIVILCDILVNPPCDLFGDSPLLLRGSRNIWTLPKTSHAYDWAKKMLFYLKMLAWTYLKHVANILGNWNINLANKLKHSITAEYPCLSKYFVSECDKYLQVKQDFSRKCKAWKDFRFK